MSFTDQASYEAYYSPEHREIRRRAAEQHRERAVSEALGLFSAGDIEGARRCLLDAGIQEEGVCYYLATWRS